MKNLAIARLTAMLAMTHARTGPDADGAGGSGTGTGGSGGAAPAPAALTPASSGDAGKTFTQTELDSIIADRLERDRKARDADAKAKADREKMDAEQRAEADKKEAEDRATQAETKAKLAGYRADLKGEVVDVNAALKLIDEDKHVKDGAVDVKALLKDFAFLAPARSTAPGAGGVQGTPAGDPTSSLSAAMAADGINLG